MNTKLLLKLLAMTASHNDAEALVAIRKANAMLAQGGTTWTDLLGGTFSKSDLVDVANVSDLNIAEQITQAFKELGVQIVYNDVQLHSLFMVFEQRKYLSPDQRRPLFEAVRKKRAAA